MKHRTAKHEPPYLWMGPRFSVWLELNSDDSHKALDVIVAQLIERFAAKVIEEYPPGVHDGNKEYITLSIDGQQFTFMRLCCFGTGLSSQNTGTGHRNEVWDLLSAAIDCLAGVGKRVFVKRAFGQRSWLATTLLLPYLLFSLATWHLIRSPITNLRDR